MIVHLFKRAGAGQCCLSTDRSGANIPPGLNGESWIYVRDLAVMRGEVNVVLDPDDAVEDLEQAGYHLFGGWYDDAR